MFRPPAYPRAIAGDVAEIERRLRSLEQRLERLGSRASAGAAQAADRIGDVVAAARADIAARLRGGSRSAGDQALRLGGEAARLGSDAWRRVTDEIRRRPLAALAIVAGLGILLGLSSRRS